MVYNKMRYVGMVKDEREAAQIYDTIAIQYQGDIARTNFPYTKKEVMKILSQRPYFLRRGTQWRDLEHIIINITLLKIFKWLENAIKVHPLFS